MLALSLILSAGCGGRESYHVSGRAQYADGSPITGGVRVIRLEPAGDFSGPIRKAASSPIAEDGSFEMFTRKPGDGVIPGRYAVTFTVLNNAMEAKSLIPPKYTQGNTTPLEITVDGNKTDLLFELEKK